MTREEALPKQKSLDEIVEAIRRLPRLDIDWGGQHVTPPCVNLEKVIAIIGLYRR